MSSPAPTFPQRAMPSTAVAQRPVHSAPPVQRVRSTAASVLAVTGGAAFLLARPALVSLGPPARVAAFALASVAVLALSLAVPVERGARRLHPVVVTAIGLGAFGVALAAGGRPVPAPYVAAALPLAVLAAVAEEALLRRVAFDAVERLGARHASVAAVVATAIVFALVHVPLYGVAVFPVDLGAGLVLSWQRWASGSWTAPAATHAAVNVLMTVMR